MTTSPALPSLLTGALFGAALTTSAVYQPSVIISQLRLTSTHMLLTFISASACSALLVAAANRTGYARLAPRTPSAHSQVLRYDANVVGGALQGVAMAMTGACPGTVLVQIALGVSGGWAVGVGGLLGGVLWVRYGDLLKRTPSSSCTVKSVSGAQDSANSKIHGKEQSNNTATSPSQSQSQSQSQSPSSPQSNASKRAPSLSPTTILLGYELLCLAIILAALALPLPIQVSHPSGPLGTSAIHPLTGGLLIATAQASSILLTRKTIGVSSAYEDAGKWFWSFFAPSSSASTPSPLQPTTTSLLFAAGIMLGAKTVAQYLPTLGTASAHSSFVSGSSNLPVLIAGGAISILGARLAGGCTSGHGISGMATMGPSSFVTVGAMFAAGMGAAWVMG